MPSHNNMIRNQKELSENFHTTYTQWYEGRLIVIENVPAQVCEQCGETYYAPAIVEQIQALIWSGAKPDRVIETDVYDLDAA